MFLNSVGSRLGLPLASPFGEQANKAVLCRQIEATDDEIDPRIADCGLGIAD